VSVEIYLLNASHQANIRAKRREEFRAQLAAPSEVREPTGAWLDPRVPTKPAARTKRALRFHEPGKFRQLAERLRMKVRCGWTNIRVR
jgi:U4/U6 small nuclear ribonucleoprotein PRP3